MRTAVNLSFTAPKQLEQPGFNEVYKPGWTVFEGATIQEIRDKVVAQLDASLAGWQTEPPDVLDRIFEPESKS